MEVGCICLSEIRGMCVSALLRLRLASRRNRLRRMRSLVLCGIDMGRKSMLSILRVNLALTRRLMLGLLLLLLLLLWWWWWLLLLLLMMLLLMMMLLLLLNVVSSQSLLLRHRLLCNLLDRRRSCSSM
jgi:hypothetical protein